MQQIRQNFVRRTFDHLDELEKNERLGKSERRYRLLRYLVAAELEGRGSEVNAYAIALAVFHRGKDFDPASDSIVRVELSRLREKLDLYYLRNTPSSKIMIEVLKGSVRSRTSDLLLNDSTPFAGEEYLFCRKSLAVLICASMAVGLVSSFVTVWLTSGSDSVQHSVAFLE